MGTFHVIQFWLLVQKTTPSADPHTSQREWKELEMSLFYFVKCKMQGSKFPGGHIGFQTFYVSRPSSLTDEAQCRTSQPTNSSA